MLTLLVRLGWIVVTAVVIGLCWREATKSDRIP